MKKKTTWAASVVKKQLQTCCKHQTFSLETTERDDCTTTSQGFGSPSRVIHISSPIREVSSADPVLQRRKSFNVLHGRSLLTTPEPLTPFRKSVESAIPLCRSSSTPFKSSQKLQNAVKSSPDGRREDPPPKTKVVLHKSGPLPVLQQLLRSGGIVSSPLNVKKNVSGPLLGRPPASPKRQQSVVVGGPSPQPRISKVKFFPIPPTHGGNKLSSPPTTQIVLVKARKQITPVLDERGGSPGSKSVCYPPASLPRGDPATEFVAVRPRTDGLDGAQRGDSNVREEDEPADRDYIAAAVKIQAAYRGHQTRRELLRGSYRVSEDDDPGEALSISTQMSRTDPQKQLRRNPPARVNKGWNGSLRSAQDHQALLRSRQEAALKRERAMEYALSRQRWRPGSKPSKGLGWITDDRLPDKPGWVRNWLERATRMSVQNSQHRVFNDEFDHNHGNHPPESESLSMKSTVGMCTTDIGSVEVGNLGWPLSLRQQHAAGLLQSKTPEPPPQPPPTSQIVATPPPLAPPHRKRSKHVNHLEKIKCHKFHEQFNVFSTSTADSRLSSRPHTSDESPPDPRIHVEEDDIDELSVGRIYCGHDSTDRESVGSCEGPVPAATVTKVPSPGGVATKPRLQQQQQQQHKVSNSSSQKEAAKLRGDKPLALHPQSQVSVALSGSNSADTTAASIQRPLWR